MFPNISFPSPSSLTFQRLMGGGRSGHGVSCREPTLCWFDKLTSDSEAGTQALGSPVCDKTIDRVALVNLLSEGFSLRSGKRSASLPAGCVSVSSRSCSSHPHLIL